MGEIEKAPRAGGAFFEMSSAGCLDNSEIKPPREKTQIKFHEAEFDAEIALALTASGAERNRQRAREQFIEANDVFSQFQEARAAEGTSIWAEAFL